METVWLSTTKPEKENHFTVTIPLVLYDLIAEIQEKALC